MREIADIHEPLAAYLRKRGIPFIRHRSDRKSGIAKGWPDFTVLWQGKAVCLEAKVIGGKLSPEQQEQILLIRGSGTPCYVINSAEQGIRHAQTSLGLENELQEPLEAQKQALSEGGDAKCTTDVGNTDGQLTGNLARNASPNNSPRVGSSGAVKSNPEAAQNFRIANIRGTDWVIAPDAEGVYDRIRRASALDIANFKRVNP